jgi:hypothetical protein
MNVKSVLIPRCSNLKWPYLSHILTILHRIWCIRCRFKVATWLLYIYKLAKNSPKTHQNLKWPMHFTKSSMVLLEGMVASGRNHAWLPEGCSSPLVWMRAVEREHIHEGWGREPVLSESGNDGIIAAGTEGDRVLVCQSALEYGCEPQSPKPNQNSENSDFIVCVFLMHHRVDRYKGKKCLTTNRPQGWR